MAFTAPEVEEGTGKSTAIVYGLTTDPVVDALAYLNRRGRTAFAAALLADQEKHLVDATDYIDSLVREFVLGFRKVTAQALVMPRGNLVVDGNPLSPDAVPTLYLQAVWEAGDLRARGETLGPVVEDQRNVKRENIAGAIETEWFGGGAVKAKTYPQIEILLGPFMRPRSAMVRG